MNNVSDHTPVFSNRQPVNRGGVPPSVHGFKNLSHAWLGFLTPSLSAKRPKGPPFLGVWAQSAIRFAFYVHKLNATSYLDSVERLSNNDRGSSSEASSHKVDDQVGRHGPRTIGTHFKWWQGPCHRAKRYVGDMYEASGHVVNFFTEVDKSMTAGPFWTYGYPIPMLQNADLGGPKPTLVLSWIVVFHLPVTVSVCCVHWQDQGGERGI